MLSRALREKFLQSIGAAPIPDPNLDLKDPKTIEKFLAGKVEAPPSPGVTKVQIVDERGMVLFEQPMPSDAVSMMASGQFTLNLTVELF